MKAIGVVVLCLSVYAVAFAQTSCNDAIDDWSLQCVQINQNKPFCTIEDPTQPSPVLRCTQCRPGNLCDCPLGQYCSIEPGPTRGTCVNFAAFGKSCLPYPNRILLNNSFSPNLKCADLFSINGVLFPNFEGTCYDGICRFCDPGHDVESLDQSCLPGQGTGPARTCVYPGVVTYAIRAFWDANVYYADRVAVWLAVYFPFFIICTICLIIIAFFSFKS